VEDPVKITAKRKPEAVEAIVFDGTNKTECEAALQKHTGNKIALVLEQQDAGVLVVLQPNRRWQTMPAITFDRIYDRDVPKNCFDCKHYGVIDGAGRCGIWDEPIDSEIVDGADCDAFER
jgi:hypothetical protein